MADLASRLPDSAPIDREVLNKALRFAQNPNDASGEVSDLVAQLESIHALIGQLITLLKGKQ